ncbi:LuxR family transcriptional regulator [Undibacterium seohonense]|jgi:LuxR family quorum-sensing transcriptional regulator LasR|uniref:LuxR family transcriptional regulator n=1 Tax=Undibacterium seohonense TaxID=1344950 RepID=A0ABR6X1I9_9BURK|nr:LuxR family transcriptional regulator [Undibacterium seohonense]MBC3806234.1 LuxR family transcriptional regulator [Undibacterium seohonense]
MSLLQTNQLLSLFEANSQTEWNAKLEGLASQLGFKNILFGLVTDKRQPLETAYLVSNFPHAWRSAYDQQHMHNVDPTVAHCLTSYLPIAWQSETFHGPAQGKFYEQACGYGLRSGISFPMHGSGNEFGMLSFVANDKDHAANSPHIEELAVMSMLRDYALESSRKFVTMASQPAVRIKLTASELECLKWVTAGKSSWEVSRILNRSEATVNFHVANIMRKFDVQTRQQAVVKAIKLGIITPS